MLGKKKRNSNRCKKATGCGLGVFKEMGSRFLCWEFGVFNYERVGDWLLVQVPGDMGTALRVLRLQAQE